MAWLCLACTAQAAQLNKIAAVGNGQVITMFDLQKAALPELGRASLNPNDPKQADKVNVVFRKVLDSMIMDILLEQEAKRLSIPVFAMVDTCCDPTDIDYVIPANDDATKSIAVVLEAMCAAIAEGTEERKLEKEKEAQEADAEGATVKKEGKPRIKKAVKAAIDAEQAAVAEVVAAVETPFEEPAVEAAVEAVAEAAAEEAAAEAKAE